MFHTRILEILKLCLRTEEKIHTKASSLFFFFEGDGGLVGGGGVGGERGVEVECCSPWRAK